MARLGHISTLPVMVKAVYTTRLAGSCETSSLLMRSVFPLPDKSMSHARSPKYCLLSTDASTSTSLSLMVPIVSARCQKSMQTTHIAHAMITLRASNGLPSPMCTFALSINFCMAPVKVAELRASAFLAVTPTLVRNLPSSST